MTGGFSEFGCFFPLPLGLPGLRFAGVAFGSTAKLIMRTSVVNRDVTLTLHDRWTGLGWHTWETVFHERWQAILGSC